MKGKKKMIIVIVCIIIIFIGIVIATTSTNWIMEHFVKSGTVEVDEINLQLKDIDGNVSKEIKNWEPGDINQISWSVKNLGTAAVYTRNKIQIYWNEDVVDNPQYIFLYPDNMSKEEILEDFKKGENSTYAIKATAGDININENTAKKGIEYEFLGDVLDGTKMTGKSEEVNYNDKSFPKSTDDDKTNEDTIAFKMLFSPKTSYLYEGKTVTVKVITEAMQYTDNGKAEWKIVDSQVIGD